MADELTRINRLEKQAQTAQAQADQLQGRLDGLKEELVKLCGTSVPEKVEKKIAGWDKEAEKLKTQLGKLLDEIEGLVNG